MSEIIELKSGDTVDVTGTVTLIKVVMRSEGGRQAEPVAVCEVNKAETPAAKKTRGK